MTPDTYRRRIDHMATITAWADANPFRPVAIQRLERAGLSWLGRPQRGRHGVLGPKATGSFSDFERHSISH